VNQRPTLLKPLGPASLADEADFQLGGICVRPSLREVEANGARESLEPRVMQVLVALTRANGAVLSRDELIRQCWGGRIVGEDAINRCVSKVRQLSELGGGKAFEIETIPRVGYRLIRSPSSAPAARPHSLVAAPVSDRTYRSGWPHRWAMLGLAAVLLLMFAFVAVRFLPAMKLFSPGPSSTMRPTSSAVTLAVLPFTNMSGNRGEEYFSDGMTEEVNGALSNISGLHIIARRSAFRFKNQNQDVRNVAKLLGATDIIEGSIRKDGSRVRVSAQLIRGADGVQLWSHTYERNLTDIFAIQEEIASSIAAALRIPLGLDPGEQLVANRTRNLDSYEQYLRARALYRGRHVQEAISILEPAVQRDPNYAPAHSLLAMAYNLIPVYLLNESRFTSIAAGRAAIEGIYVKSEAQARLALRLDPHQSEAYVAIALNNADRLNWIAAEDNFRRAFSINPNDADAIHLYGLTLADMGRLRDALASRKKLHEIEPFVPIYNVMTAAMLQLTGKNTEALAMLAATPGSGPTTYFRNIYLARGYAIAGRYAEAADALLAMSPEVKRVSRKSVEDAATLLRKLAQSQPLPEPLPQLEGELGFVYAFTAEPQEVLAGVERDLALNFGDLAPFDSPWLPLYSPVRGTERFLTLVRNAGLVTYWRRRQWADHCHAVGAGEIQCN
jgi:TolB-like protein/DNA-binding winged helix-turn-helix (wHTH) protein/Flp pilus assembly protein TadD